MDDWIVDFAETAVRDLEAVKERQERRALFAAVDKLRRLGPRLAPPHSKSLRAVPGVQELRPRRGDAKTRALYFRSGATFVVASIAADHARDMAGAIHRARACMDARKTWRPDAS